MFFFSYAREDWKKPMEAFFDQINDQIGRMMAVTQAEVSFRDVSDLTAGEFWAEHVLEALGRSAVFVAMFTPWYFEHVSNKRCFCGREFTAFLNRSVGTHQHPRQTNIVPVLWTVPWHKPDFLPQPVKDLNFMVPINGVRLPDNYQKRGLEWLWGRGRNGRLNVRDAIIDQILRYAQAPLPALPAIPDMDAVPCAFHAENIETASFPEATSANIATGGPSRLVLIYALTGSEASDDRDFRVQREAFSKGYIPQCRRWSVGAAGGRERVMQALETSSRANNTTVLVVRSDLLPNADVDAVLASDRWQGGVLVLGAASSVSSGTHLASAAPTPADVPNALSDLIIGLGARLRRSGTPSSGTPRGDALPSL